MKKLKILMHTLKSRKLTVAFAESVSAGYASYLLTKTPGSSKVFKGSLILYSLDAKNKFCNIPLTTLKKSQGVSKNIALRLAKRVRALFGADIGGAIVGFGGPGVKKGIKVGTVYIALSSGFFTTSQKILIEGSRDTVRRASSKLLIELLYKHLIKE